MPFPPTFPAQKNALLVVKTVLPLFTRVPTNRAFPLTYNCSVGATLGTIKDPMNNLFETSENVSPMDKDGEPGIPICIEFLK